MSYRARVLRVMIASPGDVETERLQAREVIHEWNAVHSEERELVLMPVGWESHASPRMGVRAQEVINAQVLRDCDLLVAIFWTRLGTPTGDSPSGTVEEIEEHLEAGKPALLYFSSAPVHPDSVDPDQLRAVREYRDSCRARGLIEEYASVGEFRALFWRHLAQTVMREFPGENVEETDEVRPYPAEHRHEIPPLAEAAGELLVAAASDETGVILCIETFGGTSIQIGGRQFVSANDPRSTAKWRSALDELRRFDLVVDRGYKGEVFNLTAEGYRVADLLREVAARAE
jgi:hypothetical protein